MNISPSRSTRRLTVLSACSMMVAVMFVSTSSALNWDTAKPAVFASGVQNTIPSAQFRSVSCASVGNCTAVGSFTNAAGGYEAFTMTSTAGTWANAQRAVFADLTQNTTPFARFQSVSCASAGNCTAVGSFSNAAGGYEAFTMTSTAGTWANAQRAVFADLTQNTTPRAQFNSVSCASAGNCTAVGSFTPAGGGNEAFTMTSTAGTWNPAQPAVFADAIQNASPIAQFESVSCASAGNCTAVGAFRNTASGDEAFTMTSTAGMWATAQPAVFADAIQNTTPNGYFSSVSCASVGNCSAVGWFTNTAGGYEAFTITSSAGMWATAQPAVFAGAIQNASPYDYFGSVSCASAGNCTAVGYFKNAAGRKESFTLTSTAGTWATAQPAVFAAGIQSTRPDAGFYSVSCASAGNCTAAGYFKYPDAEYGEYEAFTMTVTAPAPTTTTTTVAPAPTTTVAQAATTTTVAATTTTTTVAKVKASGIKQLPSTGSDSSLLLTISALFATAGVIMLSRRRTI